MLSYHTVVRSLFAAIPVLRSTGREWDVDLPSVVFDEFARHLCEAIRRGKDPLFVEQSLRFLDRMAEVGDEEVINLLVVSVLEMIADDDTCTRRCREAAGEKVRALLERVVAGWPQVH